MAASEQYGRRQSGGSAQADRLPPHSPEAERGVLGCILLDAKRLTEAQERLGDGRVFYDLANREIFMAMSGVVAKGAGLDFITLGQQLRDLGQLEEVGGFAYLNSLPEQVPSAANLSYYLEIIWEKYLARKLVQTSIATVEQVYEHNGTTEALWGRIAREREEFQKLTERGDGVAPKYLRRPGEFAEDVLAQLVGDVAAEAPGLDLPIPFPLRIRPNETTLVTGDDGAGKTTRLLYDLLHLAAAGERVCLACMETPKATTVWMLASMLLGRRRVPDSDAGRKEAAAALGWLNERFWIYDFLGITDWREMLDTFRYAAEKHGCRQFLVDSVMRIGIADDDYAAQGFCAAAFANFAMKHEAHLWHVIHENKSGESGKGRIRGSKMWTANACNVLRVERNLKKAENLSKLLSDIISAKQEGKPDAGEIKALQDKIDAEHRNWDSRTVLQKQRWPGTQQNGSRVCWFEPGNFQFRAHWQDQAVNWLERWKRKRGVRSAECGMPAPEERE